MLMNLGNDWVKEDSPETPILSAQGKNRSDEKNLSDCESGDPNRKIRLEDLKKSDETCTIEMVDPESKSASESM